jgi:hypothetical protein
MRDRREDGLQIGVVKLLTRAGYWPVHVPNEGKRSRWGHIRQLQMGLWPGFPDLLVFDAAGIAFALELKAPPRRGRSGQNLAARAPDERQAWTHERLAERGVPVIVVYSIEGLVEAMRRRGFSLNAAVTA